MALPARSSSPPRWSAAAPSRSGTSSAAARRARPRWSRTATSTSTSARRVQRGGLGRATARRASATAARLGVTLPRARRAGARASMSSSPSQGNRLIVAPAAPLKPSAQPKASHGSCHRPGRHRRHLHLPDLQDRAAAERLGGRAPGQVRPHADAGPELRDALHRARGLQAFAEGNAARRAEPGLHHQGQHPAAGRRHHLLPGHRPDARQLRLEQLRLRHHPAGADAAALGDRQDGTRQDLRGARRDQRRRRQRARRGGAELGREGAALRDQGPDAAGRDPALRCRRRSPPSARSAR